MKYLINWDEQLAPVIVQSTQVEPVASNLLPIFKFFRHNYLLLTEEPSNSSWMYFPGIFSASREKLVAFAELQEQYGLETKTAYPRGWLDSPIVICGIAPGTTVKKYHEAMWLFGPSSTRLHTAVGFPEFFTNVSHDAFPGNTYDHEKALREKHILEAELAVIKPKVLLLLGKYEIFNQLKIPAGTRKVQVYHPSYIRRHLELEAAWMTKIREALAGFSASVVDYRTLANADHFSPEGMERQFSVSSKLFDVQLNSKYQAGSCDAGECSAH